MCRECLFTARPPERVLNAGADALSVTFISTDTTNFATVSGSAIIAVSQVPLAVTANNAARNFWPAQSGLHRHGCRLEKRG